MSKVTSILRWLSTKIGSSGSSGEVSREGVQRDLLPLIEGCTVNTKYGMIKTDHVLFIASGAFHLSRPSDLVPELQGRLPIRVELGALSVEDFKRILIEPDSALTMQYQELMKTEGLGITFTEDGINRIAEVAWHVNEKTENIGARRLHTVLERLLEDISFSADQLAKDKEAMVINSEYVDKQLSDSQRRRLKPFYSIATYLAGIFVVSALFIKCRLCFFQFYINVIHYVSF